MNKESHKNDFIDAFDVALIVIIGGFFIAAVFVFLIIRHKNSYVAATPEQATSTPVVVEKPYNDPFKKLKLEAKAVYVYDIKENKVIYSYNSTTALPLASLTKLMTAVTAKKYLKDNSEVTISDEALAEDGDTGLQPNERWNFKNLLDFTLLVSSNDGARAVALAAQNVLGSDSQGDGQSFMGAMNREASQLGFQSMHFDNPTGLDLDMSRAGAYGSAEDISKLMAYILKTDPASLEATSYGSLMISSEQAVHSSRNTNTIADEIPGLIASKTGYSDLAGGNLMIAMDVGIGHPVIVTVLGSSYDGRFTDTKKLIDATRSHFAQKTEE